MKPAMMTMDSQAMQGCVAGSTCRVNPTALTTESSTAAVTAMQSHKQVLPIVIGAGIGIGEVVGYVAAGATLGAAIGMAWDHMSGQVSTGLDSLFGSNKVAHIVDPENPAGTANPGHVAQENQPAASGAATPEATPKTKPGEAEPGTASLAPPERLAKVYDRLGQLPPARTADEALDQLNRTLDEVEDEYSGVAKNPNPGLKFDGRMYPPREDFLERNADRSITAMTKGNEIHASSDGSIRILSRRTGQEVYNKKGAGG